MNSGSDFSCLSSSNDEEYDNVNSESDSDVNNDAEKETLPHCSATGNLFLYSYKNQRKLRVMCGQQTTPKIINLLKQINNLQNSMCVP